MMLSIWAVAIAVSSSITVPASAAIVIFLTATPLRNRRLHTRLFVLGLVALLFAWVNVLGISETKPFTFATSIPFLAMAAWLGLLIHGRDLPAWPRNGPRGFEVVQPPGVTKTVVRPPPPALTSGRAHRHPQ